MIKSIIILFSLTVFIGFNSLNADTVDLNNLKEIWLEEDNSSILAILENEQINEAHSKGNDLINLLKAKFKLINGDLNMAKFYLNRIDEKTSPFYNLKKRYLSTIFFIEGHYSQSLAMLSSKELSIIENYKHICLLKLINKMATNNLENMSNEANICKTYTGKYSKNDQYWLDVMLKLKEADPKEVNRQLLTDVESTINNDEMSKIWLKSGLFLNKEEDFLSALKILTEDSFQSNKLRELIAFMYIRNNKLNKALSFIEDIESANAYNLKGNINLKKEEYELAYGNFKLALTKKSDSQNALDRATPLSWLLGQWNDGLNLLENPSNSPTTNRNKRALRTAFYIRNNNYVDAKKEIILLKKEFQGDPPFEVNIMDSYVSMILPAIEKSKQDKRKSEDSAEKGCKSFDGISCYIALSHLSYNNLGKTLLREDEIFQDKHFNIEDLKKQVEISPLKETITVDQQDIEELDSENVKIKY